MLQLKMYNLVTYAMIFVVMTKPLKFETPKFGKQNYYAEKSKHSITLQNRMADAFKFLEYYGKATVNNNYQSLKRPKFGKA